MLCCRTRLIDAVQAFEATFPTVTLRLHVEALKQAARRRRLASAVDDCGGLLPAGDVLRPAVVVPAYERAIAPDNLPAVTGGAVVIHACWPTKQIH
jgi:hypothetical protein